MSDDASRSLSAAVLAGGASQRFGSAKGDALFEGRSLIEHAFEAVAPLAEEVMISLGATADRLPSSAAGMVPIVDEYRGCGPLAGIHACLRMAAHPWLLVLACDLPFVRTDSLRKLTSACAEPWVVVHAGVEGGRAQPLCGCYHRSMLEAMDQALYEGRYGVLRFLEEMTHVRRVDLPAAELINVNRPEDLASGRGGSE
jgi:molybdopterin-guanine dinucleotide biosynthesis protein A